MEQGREMGFLEISHSSCYAAMGEKDKTGTLFCAYLNVNPKDQDNVPASSFHAECQHNSNSSKASVHNDKVRRRRGFSDRSPSKEQLTSHHPLINRRAQPISTCIQTCLLRHLKKKHMVMPCSKTTVRCFEGSADQTASSNSHDVVYFTCPSGQSYLSPGERSTQIFK